MKIKKKWMAGYAAAGIVMAITSITAFAGQWERDNTGWWYLEDDGSYPAAQWSFIDGEWYYFGDDGYMAHDSLVDGIHYVGSDGRWQEKNAAVKYSESELLAVIQASCPYRIDGLPFTADFNSDGRMEMVVQAADAADNLGAADSWNLYYWYTDGEHTYSFGQDNITGWTYDAEFSLIPTSAGSDLIINRNWRPMAFGGYMTSAYIYRIRPDGAAEMFSRDCCRLEEPQYEAVHAVNYNFEPGMGSVRSEERLQLNGECYQ